MAINSVMRPIAIFLRLQNGEILNKQALADEYDVNLRTIQRDISNLNAVLANEVSTSSIQYNATTNGYMLQNDQHQLTSHEIFLLLKMLVENHSLNAAEFERVKNGLVGLIKPSEWDGIRSLVIDEITNYHPINHGKNIIDLLWGFSIYVKHKKAVLIEYQGLKGTREYILYPQAITMDEYYFYFLAYSERHPETLATYRIDRVLSHRPVSGATSYAHRPLVSDSEFKAKTPYMQFGGGTVAVQFEYRGLPEPALDRFPHSKIIKQLENSNIIEVKAVSESGIMMWLLSQGDYVTVLQPQSLVNAMKAMLARQLKNYD